MPPQPIHAIQRAIRTTLLLTLPSTDRLLRKFQCNNFQELQYIGIISMTGSKLVWTLREKLNIETIP